MRQLLDKILRPKRNQLIYFGIFISFFLLYGLYVISFSWGIGFGLHVEVIYGILFFMLFAAFLHDRYNNTQLKKYFLLTICLFTIYTLISVPTMAYLKRASENQIKLLGVQIANYQQRTGKYPVDLSDKSFSTYSKRSYLGTRIFINTHITEDKKDTSCYIHYLSLDGYTASFDIKTKKIFYYD
jgi:hypothetical protein